MRPRHKAAENAFYANINFDDRESFNEAAA